MMYAAGLGGLYAKCGTFSGEDCGLTVGSAPAPAARRATATICLFPRSYLIPDVREWADELAAAGYCVIIRTLSHGGAIAEAIPLKEENKNATATPESARGS